MFQDVFVAQTFMDISCQFTTSAIDGVGVFLGAEMATPRAQEMMRGLLAQMGSGSLSMPIDRTYPLSEAAAAHAYIESRQAVGRVILIP